MFNGVEYVREICRKKGIAISQLERDCGFSNGYLNPRKLKKIPYDRAVLIADYLGLSASYIVTGQETKNTPTQKGERVEMDDFTYAMQNEAKELTDMDKQILLSMAKQLNDARKQKNGETQ